MTIVGKTTDYFEKYCKKCKHKKVSETHEPCFKCIDDFFGDWKNIKRVLKGFEKEDKNECNET